MCIYLQLLFVSLSAIVASSAALNQQTVEVTCRNHRKVLEGVLDHCEPSSYHCYLESTLIVNSTELICVDENRPKIVQSVTFVQ